MTIILKNTTNSKQLTLRLVDDFVEGLSQDVWSMDFPESAAEDTLMMRMSGQSKKLTFTSSLFDSASDLSNGDSILTKLQQKDYLIGVGNTTDKIFTKGIDDEWELEINTETFPCIVEEIVIRRSASNPNHFEVNFSLIIGGSG